MSAEIQEHDMMFSTMETPWHGLGVVLDSPPSIQEGLKESKLDWDVKKLSLYAKTDKEIEVPAQAIMREDTQEILGVVGMSYEPLQNTEAFDIFDPLVSSGDLLLETAGSLKNGRRVWVLGRINTDGKDVGKDDPVNPYVLLSNSHDGTTAVRFGFTPVRVVCNNTLTAAERASSSNLIRLIHRKGIKENLEELRNMLALSKRSFEASIDAYRWLASRQINQKDLEKYVKIIFSDKPEETYKNFTQDDKDRKLTRSENKVIEFFEQGKGSIAGTNWWRGYNAFNEYLLWSRGIKIDNRIDSAWFGDGKRWDSLALDYAMRMAA